MTLLQIINTIKKIALDQPNIHSCVDEFLDLNDVSAKYSAVILQQQTHRRNNDFIQFNFYLGYSDRLNEDKSNEIEIQSTGIQVINSIVSKLEDLGFDTTMGSYNVFTERFLAETAGVYTELIISIPVGECTDDFVKSELNTTITKNGVYNYLPTTGLGFESAKITVNVPSGEIKNQKKEELITINNKRYTYTPDKDYTGIGELNVMVQIPEQPIYEEGYVVGKEDGINEQKRKLTYINITQNGTFNREDGYSSVVVDVPIPEIKNQEKNITITENGQTDITPDTGYTGLSKVSVNAAIDTQSYYDNGYSQGKIDGKTEGIAEQKAKLTDINITENGNYSREDGYKSVVVNVPSDKKPETELTKTLTANDTYTYTPDEGTVYNKVIITTDIHPTERLEKTYIENGQYLIDGEYKDGVINVNVPIPEVNNQEKSITINSNGTSSVVPDAGYTGISKMNITVNVPTSGGDGIDLTSLGYTAQENTSINTDIQDSIAYSQSLLESYTDDTKYRSNLKLVFAPKIPSTNRTNFMELFSDCSNLKTIPSIDTGNGVRFEKMFLNCGSLYKIPAIDTSNCTSFYQTFFGCKSLDNIPNLNMLNVDSCNSMFDACESLTSVYPLNIPKCRILSSMFYACSSLTSIEFVDMSSATSFNSMFGACNSLVSVKNIDLSKCVNADYMFQGCSSLTDINLIGNINVSISFEASPNLTYDSIKSILTACSNAIETTKTKKVSFNETIADQTNELTNLIASCTSKGWTVSGLEITTA